MPFCLSNDSNYVIERQKQPVFLSFKETELSFERPNLSRRSSTGAGCSRFLLTLYVVRACREPYLGPPRGAEQRGRVAATPPGLRPALMALLRVVPAAPRPPGLRPLCALRRTGPGYLSANEKGRCGLSTLGGQHSRARIGRDPRSRSLCFFIKKRRRPGQLECVKRSAFCTRKASVSSPENSRTRRAVHTLVVWAGELSRRGKGMNSAPAFAACEELKEGRTPQ